MSHGSRSRRLLWVVANIVGIVSAIAYATSFSRFDEWTILRPVCFFIMGFAMLANAYMAPRWSSGKAEVAAILGIAFALRIALLPTPPSDDIHRYLWEGKLVANDISPYRLRGDHPDLTPLRDEQWQLMNNKDKRTAYPPASLLAFSALGAIDYSPLAFKIAFSVVDLCVVALLLLSLRQRKLPMRAACLYACNPVVLVSFAGEGHFDSLMLLALSGAAVLMDRKHWLLAGGALAVAVQIKFIALLGLPFILFHGRWRALAGFAAMIAAISLPFIDTLPQLLLGLQQFGADRDFNGLPNLFGNALGLSRGDIYPLVQALFLASLAWRWIRHRGRDDWHGHWLWTCGSLLLLAPTTHFWYLSWIAISIVFAPSLLWTSLCLTQGFYFLVWKDYLLNGTWDLLDWQSALLWLPAILFIPIGCVRILQRIRQGRSKQHPSASSNAVARPVPDDSLLVIIPTLNAGPTIEACLSSLLPQLEARDKVVICDASSSDETRTLAEAMGVETIDAPQGRGNQIHAGLARMDSRYALVLHADTQLCHRTLDTLRAFLKRNPHVVGGALGQRFTAPQLLPYRLIEFLNEARSHLLGISFGDQCQFFDRARIPDDLFPRQPLMEDVELSYRLRENGSTAYLGLESLTDPRKWKRKANVRFMLVIKLVASYSIQRQLGPKRAERLSRRLYKLYYPKA